MSSAPSSSTPAPQLSGRALLAAAIAVSLTAMLLRGPVTCIGPMADAIVKTFGITYPEYGTLAALPIAAFGIFSFSFLFSGFAIYGSSFFTALNDGLTSASIAFLRTLVFQVGAVLTFPLLWKLDGIWLSIVAAEVMAVITTAIFLLAKRMRYGY